MRVLQQTRTRKVFAGYSPCLLKMLDGKDTEDMKNVQDSVTVGSCAL